MQNFQCVKVQNLSWSHAAYPRVECILKALQSSRLWPYSQALDESWNACQWQILEIIMNICRWRIKKFCNIGPSGQYYKTFLGIIYATRNIFSYNFDWGYADSDVITSISIGHWMRNLAAEILGHFIKGQSSNVVLMFDALWRIFYCVLYLIHSKHRTTFVRSFSFNTLLSTLF